MKYYICQICGEQITAKGFGSHLRHKHEMTSKSYYDKFLKENKEGLCPNCGKETRFLKLSQGYSKFCSDDCSMATSIPIKSRQKITMKNYGF